MNQCIAHAKMIGNVACCHRTIIIHQVLQLSISPHMTGTTRSLGQTQRPSLDTHRWSGNAKMSRYVIIRIGTEMLTQVTNVIVTPN